MQSPEKLQATLEEMAGAVERERIAVAEAEKRLRSVTTRSEHVCKVRCHCISQVVRQCSLKAFPGRKDG